MSNEPDSQSAADALAVSLQEYNAMRTEIYNRSNAQHTLINLNVTALGLVTGFVLSNQANFLLLLLAPIISSSFGLLYFDHAGAIERVGTYLGVVLRPNIVRSAGEASLEWERFATYAFNRNRAARTAFAIPLFSLFLGAPIISTIAVTSALNQPWLWTIWALGISLEVLLLATWWQVVSGRSFKLNQNLGSQYSRSVG